jgi:ketosteroid isomerase-like protein
MKMPICVQAYFDADSRNDPDALTALFSADAIVEDERARHQGPDAIRQRWASAKAKSNFVNEPIETTATDDETIVRARVSGDFPGSPATLRFGFTIRYDKIIKLEIG